jgi:hypothetical protein
MPARSNDFQALVTLIERQLHDATTVTLTESKQLRDGETGRLRELDVVIEARVGTRTVVIAVECRDRSRPASVQWIDELLGKYDRLPVDRVVAVSRSGFTKGALAKAALVGIETLSLEAAATVSWPSLIGRLTEVHIDAHLALTARAVTLLFAPPLPESELPQPSDVPSCVLVDPDGNEQGTVAEYVDRLLTRDDLVDAIYEHDPGDGIWTIQTRIDLRAGTTVRTPGGEVRVVGAIDLAARFVRERISVPLEPASYGTVSVRHGAGHALGARIVAAAVEHDDDEVTLSLDVRRKPQEKR